MPCRLAQVNEFFITTGDTGEALPGPAKPICREGGCSTPGYGCPLHSIPQTSPSFMHGSQLCLQDPWSSCPTQIRQTLLGSEVRCGNLELTG